ncbi:MAG: cytochrome c oxidase subunit 3 [Planctomycetota bacterium]|jgi:cytochrome c oxidase subunit 3
MEQPTTIDPRWTSGLSPFGMTWQKFMMWWFVVGDALLFAGFLASYGFSRIGSANWPDPAEAFSIPFLTVMTFTLISSSVAMACAVAASKAGDSRTTAKMLLLTMLGGIAFLVMQAIEWALVISHGARLWSNPWGDKDFGAYFFMMTGFHGTHVLIGVIILLICWLRARKQTVTPNGVEIAGLYWHFVDLVWVFIFGCFYLL